MDYSTLKKIRNDINYLEKAEKQMSKVISTPHEIHFASTAGGFDIGAIKSHLEHHIGHAAAADKAGLHTTKERHLKKIKQGINLLNTIQHHNPNAVKLESKHEKGWDPETLVSSYDKGGFAINGAPLNVKPKKAYDSVSSNGLKHHPLDFRPIMSKELGNNYLKDEVSWRNKHGKTFAPIYRDRSKEEPVMIGPKDKQVDLNKLMAEGHHRNFFVDERAEKEIGPAEKGRIVPKRMFHSTIGQEHSSGLNKLKQSKEYLSANPKMQHEMIHDYTTGVLSSDGHKENFNNFVKQTNENRSKFRDEGRANLAQKLEDLISSSKDHIDTASDKTTIQDGLNVEQAGADIDLSPEYQKMKERNHKFLGDRGIEKDSAKEVSSSQIKKKISEYLDKEGIDKEDRRQYMQDNPDLLHEVFPKEQYNISKDGKIYENAKSGNDNKPMSITTNVSGKPEKVEIPKEYASALNDIFNRAMYSVNMQVKSNPGKEGDIQKAVYAALPRIMENYDPKVTNFDNYLKKATQRAVRWHVLHSKDHTTRRAEKKAAETKPDINKPKVKEIPSDKDPWSSVE